MTTALLLPAILFSVAAHAETVMVGLEHPQAAETVSHIVQSNGGAIRCWRNTPLCVAELPMDGVSAIAALPGVRYVERDRPMDVPAPPARGTTDCPDPWELEMIGAAEAWQIADGTHAPVIAIQDSGFRTTHVEIAERISGQYDYGNLDTDPEVERASGVPAHGTFIAGLIAADPDNAVGRSGVAPYARMNLQKIADDDGALYFSYAVAAMADLADGDLGVRVLNYSIGTSSSTASFEDAVAALDDVGILVVAAAGNCASAHCIDADNDTHPMYPANFATVISVAGTLRDDSLNSYSHYGASSVDLAAPGVDLCSCGVDSDTDFYTASGTSYATPLVAATAALLLEAHPDLTTIELGRVLRASAREVPALAGLVRSGGRLDAAAALSTAVPRLSSPPDIALDGAGVLTVDTDNAAASGTAWLVLTHDDRLDALSAMDAITDEEWSLSTFAPGEPFSLPDAGEITVEESFVTVVTGTISAHESAAVEITLAGRETGTIDATARVVMTSDGADYLNAPYDSGEADPTGFLAWGFAVDVREVADTEPVDTGPTGTGPTDTADEETGRDSADMGGSPHPDAPDEGDPEACGCRSAASAGSLGWLLAGLASARRFAASTKIRG